MDWWKHDFLNRKFLYVSYERIPITEEDFYYKKIEKNEAIKKMAENLINNGTLTMGIFCSPEDIIKNLKLIEKQIIILTTKN